MGDNQNAPYCRLSLTRRTLSLWLIIISLAVTLGAQVATVANGHPDNRTSFINANSSFESYLQLRQEWRTRVFSNCSALIAKNIVAPYVEPGKPLLRATVVLHTTFWFCCIAVVLWRAFGARSLFAVMGTFAAFMFAYCTSEPPRVYPWDLPPVFFFSLFLVCIERRATRYLPLIIAAAVPFKETAIILSIFHLFEDKPMKERLRSFISLLILCVMVKTGIDLITNNPSPLFSMTVTTPHHARPRVLENLRAIFSPLLIHPIFINAGSLVALMLFASSNRNLILYRTLAAFFGCGILFCGMALEYRIWLELAPIAFYLVGEEIGKER